MSKRFFVIVAFAMFVLGAIAVPLALSVRADARTNWQPKAVAADSHVDHPHTVWVSADGAVRQDDPVPSPFWAAAFGMFLVCVVLIFGTAITLLIQLARTPITGGGAGRFMMVGTVPIYFPNRR